ncbi:MAG TPA: NAD-dependent protein deacylase [Firmicutes bacterium]|nr:NAD-dependent protein deacylase [Bacillota bacterium]
MNTDKNIEILRQMVEDSNHIVFFGGAGVSTESNIPDFRSDDGIYQKKEFPYPPEVMLSHEFYLEHTKLFFEFYRTMLYPNAKPNAAHLKLAELEYQKKLDAVVTQNIDGLHQMAGSKNVYELHGSVKRNYCEKCRSFYDESIILESEGIPQCPRCGGTVKPDVVLYGEGLDQNVISGAVNAIGNADMLIVGGTSLVVYPAAGLVNYYHGDRLVLINRDVTSYDSKANLIFHENIGEVLSKI